MKSLIKRSLKKISKSYIISNILILVVGFLYPRKYPKVPEKLNIVLNGPSLLDSKESILRSRDETIVANQFAEHELYEVIKPKYYILQDAYFWNAGLLEKYTIKRERAFEAINRKTAWDLVLYVPHNANINFLQEKITNEKIKLFPYYAEFIRCGDKYFNSYVKKKPLLFYLWRKNYCAPPPENVLVGATYVAYLGGVKNISVYGCDMSFFKGLEVDQNTNAVGIRSQHFYGEEFDIHYKDKTGREPTTMAYELEKWAKVFKVLEVLNEFYLNSGVEVANKSKSSYVDAFDRE